MQDIQKRNKRQNDWIRDNSDRINFMMPKGMKARIKAYADRLGVTSSEFIRQAIEDKMYEEDEKKD